MERGGATDWLGAYRSDPAPKPHKPRLPKLRPAQKLQKAGLIDDGMRRAAERWALDMVATPGTGGVAAYGAEAYRVDRPLSDGHAAMWRAIIARERAKRLLGQGMAEILFQFMRGDWTPEGLAKQRKAEGKPSIDPKTLRKRLAQAIKELAPSYQEDDQ